MTVLGVGAFSYERGTLVLTSIKRLVLRCWPFFILIDDDMTIAASGKNNYLAKM